MRVTITYEIEAEADIDVDGGTVDLRYDISDLPDRLLEAAWEEYERIKREVE